jgi:hypothetical protein
MELSDISYHRLQNQQLIGSEFKTGQDIVGRMGAMQAQDFEMAKWAIGIRLPGSTQQTIESAINKGEIIRTHLMRPTWHLVSSDDIYWMLELTAPQIKASMKFRDKQLELTESVYKKSRSILERSLQGNNHLSREELISEYKKANIAVDMNRASHLLMRAELDGIVCSGRLKNGKPTFALLEEWVKKTKVVKREDALTLLANKYFTSHGPATIHDFKWWSGLTVSESKQALEMIKPKLVSETSGKQVYWFNSKESVLKFHDQTVQLLPAYDEFIISYKDRSAVFPHDDFRKAVSINGVFRPVIVIKGQVAGIWQKKVKNEHVIIETKFFRPYSKFLIRLVKNAAMSYGNFLNKKVEII